MFLPCEYESRAAHCRVEARWGLFMRPNRHLEARWATSAPDVLRIASPGTLQAVAPGDANVSVSGFSRGASHSDRAASAASDG